MRKLLIVILFCMAGTAQAWVDLQDYILAPGTVKHIGIYRTDHVSAVSNDLFFEFQNRLLYELKAVSWFDVYDYEKMLDVIVNHYRDQPAAFLLTMDALATADIVSNKLVVNISFPKVPDSKERKFRLTRSKDLETVISAIMDIFRKRLPLSGEILSLEPGNIALVNLGKNFNIKPGELLVSVNSNRFPDGILRVDEVTGLSCKTKILFWQNDLGPGDTVCKMSVEFLENLHSRYVRTDIRKGISVSLPTRMPAISSQDVLFVPSPFDDSYVVSDGVNTFFMDPDRNKSVMLEKNVKILKLVWHPQSHIIAYSWGNELVVRNIDRDKKLRLLAADTSFVNETLVFGRTNDNRSPVDFCWDTHGVNFAFYVRGAGLFTAQPDFLDVRKISPTWLYDDYEGIQLSYSGNDEGLWIKTLNNYDGFSTVRYYIPATGVTRSWTSIASGRKFMPTPDWTGVVDQLVTDDNRTNLCLLTEKTDSIVLPGRFDKISFSDGGQFMVYRDPSDSRTKLISFTNRITLPLDLNIIDKTGFFPSSSELLVNGFLKDTDKNGIVDWRDQKPAYFFNTGIMKPAQTLVYDMDELLGLSATAQWLYYRKGKSVFGVRLVNGTIGTNETQGK